MNFLRDQRGQATILVALSITSLCGMVGLSVDVGMLFRAKRVLQTAADAAAIAGATGIRYGTWSASAKAAATLNGLTDGVNGATVTVNNSGQSGSHTGTGYVEVIITQSEPTYFMKLFHLSSMNVSARSVAGLGPSSGCIFTLDPSGIDIGLTGNGSLSMPDCGIVVNSASSNAVNLTGVSDLSALSIGIVGGYQAGSNTTITPTPITGIPPVTNPLDYLSPPTFNPAACLADPHPSSSATLGPSTAGGTICYNGLTVSGNGNITLNPGVYVINGSLSSSGNATISGTDVTFYLTAPNGSLSLTGGGALNVSAPTSSSNPYAGILFYQDPNDTNSMKVSGNNNSQINGIFYAPAASLTLTGTSGSNFYADLVVHALSISGTGTLKNYSNVNSNEPIQSARLVE